MIAEPTFRQAPTPFFEEVIARGRAEQVLRDYYGPNYPTIEDQNDPFQQSEPEADMGARVLSPSVVSAPPPIPARVPFELNAAGIYFPEFLVPRDRRGRLRLPERSRARLPSRRPAREPARAPVSEAGRLLGFSPLDLPGPQKQQQLGRVTVAEPTSDPCAVRARDARRRRKKKRDECKRFRTETRKVRICED